MAARGALAVVFGVSGVSKLFDRQGATDAAVGLGVPRSLARPLSIALPLVELVLAVLLLSPAYRVAAGAASLLFLVFAGAVSRTVRRGEHPDCHCFGKLHESQVGWDTVARNVGLAALGAFVAISGARWPQPDPIAWFRDAGPGATVVAIIGVLLIVAVAAGGFLIVAILRQNGRLLLRIDELEASMGGDAGHDHAELAHAGLPPGSEAPRFSLPDVFGDVITLERLLAEERPALLLFADPGCGPCELLLPDVAGWQRDQAQLVSVVVVSRGSSEENLDKVARHGLGTVLLQTGTEVATAYGYVGTPSAVLIDKAGRIASHVVAGADQIRALMETASGVPGDVVQLPEARGQVAPAPALGSPAPAFELPAITGETVALSGYRGREVVVLFWRPSCGFCDRMLPELRAWEDRQVSGAPDLLLVSTGSVAENEAMGLRSPIVLDDAGGTMRSYGATGTPIAIRVDGRGRIASEVAVGSSSVLSLLGSELTEAVT